MIYDSVHSLFIHEHGQDDRPDWFQLTETKDKSPLDKDTLQMKPRDDHSRKEPSRKLKLQLTVAQQNQQRNIKPNHKRAEQHPWTDSSNDTFDCEIVMRWVLFW